MIRKSSHVLTLGTTDPTVHEIVRTAFLAHAFPHRPLDSWRFAKMSVEFNGPFMILTAHYGDSCRVFYTQERTNELMTLLRESHSLGGDQGRVSVLAVPSNWHDDRHWTRYPDDGIELLAYPGDSGPDGAIVVLTAKERAAMISDFDDVNASEPQPA